MRTRERSEPSVPIPQTREEILAAAQILLPGVLTGTSLDGVALTDLLGKARSIKYGTGLESDRFSMSAVGLAKPNPFRRIDIRYLQDLRGTGGRDIEDTVQLMFHDVETPWGGRNHETLFVNWTETSEPGFERLYVNFVDSGQSFTVEDGEITPGSYRRGTFSRIFTVVPQLVTDTRIPSFTLSFSDYPAEGSSGLLTLPAMIQSPRIGLMRQMMEAQAASVPQVEEF